MTISKQITIWCDIDGCNEWTAIDVSVTSVARQAARAEGWRYFGGSDHCADHAGRTA